MKNGFYILFALLLSLTLVACGGSGSESEPDPEPVADTDTTAPVVTVNGDESITLYVGEEYVEQGATAEDDVDGELAVEISGTVDTSTVETYTLTYSATDSSGNTGETTRTVIVVEGQNPNQIINGINITYGSSSGERFQEELPFSEENEFPSVISSPDVVITDQTSNERVDVIFSVDSALDELYVTVEGADEYLAFLIQEEQSASSMSNSTSSANTEAVSFGIELTEEVQEGNFCLVLSAMDKTGLLSEKVQVCFTISNDEQGNDRTIYFADFSSNSVLSTLDFDTGEVANIGSVGYELTDIALYEGRLYGVTFTKLLEIDLATGEGQLIGDIGYNRVNALEGGANGLYAGTQDSEVILVDVETGAGDVIGTLDDSAYTSGDFVFNADDSVLYGSVVLPGYDNDYLVTINPETGESTLVGDIGFDQVYGLAFFRDQLLGLTDAGEFIIIDPNTGLGTLVDNTEAFSAGGAASN